MSSLFEAVDLGLLLCVLLVALRTRERVLRIIILLLGLAVLLIFGGHVVYLSLFLQGRASLTIRPNPVWLSV